MASLRCSSVSAAACTGCHGSICNVRGSWALWGRAFPIPKREEEQCTLMIPSSRWEQGRWWRFRRAEQEPDGESFRLSKVYEL